MNSAASTTMTTAAVHRHGCRSGTASIAAGPVDGDESTTVISAAPRNLADRAVDHRLVDGALLDTPVRGDLLVLAVLDQMLERLLERLRQRRALLHGPTVRRRISDVARCLQLAVALLDRVQRHR